MKKSKTVFLAMAFCLISAPSALGCLCDGTPGVAEEFREASAIFCAKFVAAEYRRGIVNEFRKMEEEAKGKKLDYEVLVLKFQVERWWKGNPGSEVILITEQTRADGMESISDCDSPFQGGKRYLIYAYGSENEFGTSKCTRTKELKKAKEDLKKLGKGRKPERTVS